MKYVRFVTCNSATLCEYVRFITSTCLTLCRKCNINLLFIQANVQKPPKWKPNVKTFSTAETAMGKSASCRYSTK